MHFKTISPNTTHELSTFTSDKIRILGTTIIIPHANAFNDLKLIVRIVNEKIEFINIENFYTQEQVNDWDHLLAERHQFTSFTSASNFYLPPHLPNFTHTGYFSIFVFFLRKEG